MSYLRPVQPLIASLIADLPDAQASAGLKDAIIFVEEDGSVRRWDAGSQSWTRRGGPLASSYATSAQGALADSSLQNAAAFASAAQGGKADSALQTVPLATLNHIISGHLDWQQIFIDKVTTTNTVPLTIWTSEVIPVQSVVYLVGTIICDNPATVGSSVVSIISVSERQTGGALVSTQSDQVNTVGSVNNITVAAVENAATNTIMLKVTSGLGVTLNWYGRLEVLRSTA